MFLDVSEYRGTDKYKFSKSTTRMCRTYKVLDSLVVLLVEVVLGWSWSNADIL